MAMQIKLIVVVVVVVVVVFTFQLLETLLLVRVITLLQFKNKCFCH